MQSAMKKMGISQRPIAATLVTIHSPSGDIVVKNPEVMELTMANQVSFQISGTIAQKTVDIPEDDINTVMEQANVDYDTAKKALEITKGDIAQAILGLVTEEKI